MSYETKQVWGFLSYLEKYLLGDLGTFHKVNEEIDKQEDLRTSQQVTSSHDDSTPSTKIVQTRVHENYSTSGYGGFKPEKVTKSFRMTQPITLSLFSTLDVIGYLTGPYNEKQNKENVKVFFDYYIHKGLVSTEEYDVISDTYRHGMSHHFFPKLDVGLSYHKNNVGKRLFVLSQEHGEDTLTLNVNTLEKLVVNRLNEVIDDFRNMREPIYTDMEKKFVSLLNIYEVGRSGKTSTPSRNHIEVLKTKLKTSAL